MPPWARIAPGLSNRRAEGFGTPRRVNVNADWYYTQFLGELNRAVPNQRYQFDVVEANVLAHVPWITEGGMDLKVGQYPTPLGYETIDPSTNPFYSHSPAGWR